MTDDNLTGCIHCIHYTLPGVFVEDAVAFLRGHVPWEFTDEPYGRWLYGHRVYDPLETSVVRSDWRTGIQLTSGRARYSLSITRAVGTEKGA